MNNESKYEDQENIFDEEKLFNEFVDVHDQRFHRFFLKFLPLQFLVVNVIAFLGNTLIFSDSETYPRFIFVFLISAFATVVPILLILNFPRDWRTRYVVGVGQIIIASIMVSVMDGSIESHLYILGSLFLIANYREWRILVLVASISIIDHFIKDFYFQRSFYEFATDDNWNWLKHSFWLAVGTAFLVYTCIRNVRKMKSDARSQAVFNEREERYKTVVEQMTESFILVSPETFGIIDCNQAFADLLGYHNVDEVKKLNLETLLTISREEVQKVAEVLKNIDHALGNETKMIRKDGSFIYVWTNKRLVTYKGRKVFCVTARDITDRKEAEDKIKRLAIVAEEIQNAVIITSKSHKIQWVNRAFEELTGYRAKEAIGKAPGEILVGDKTDKEKLAAVRELILERRQFITEMFNYRKDKRGYWASISTTPIFSNSGKYQGYISVATDLTERMEMEERLRVAYEEMENRVKTRTKELAKSEAFLTNVLDTNPDLVFTKDTKGRFTHVNKAVTDFYGVPASKLIGKLATDFNSSKDEINKIQNFDLEELKEWLGAYVFETTLKDVKDETRHFQVIKRLMLNGDEIEGVVVVANDLTERKKLEDDLRSAQKLESIGQLAAGIAHEINTPTQYVGDNTRFVHEAFEDINNVLEKYDELLETARKDNYSPELVKEVEDEIENADMEFLAEEIPSAIEQSLEGVKRIAKIVQSMKDFAHPGSEDKKAVDLNKAIESTITVARNEWKYVADLETNFDENLPNVPCKLGELNQVILNMIVNASHAIADVTDGGNQGKGKIQVSTTKVNEEWIEIQIADTGGGIPEEAQSKIFDPFFTTKEVGKGTGQGLAISHTVVVDNHQGKLSFETQQGEGTTFKIQLPLGNSSEYREERNI